MNKEKNIQPGALRIRTITYRITTFIVIIGMLAGGASQLFRFDYQTQVFIQLGYPLYLMAIIGAGKILGAIILIIPRFPLLKICAYAGLFFVTISAVISHATMGDIQNMVSPLFVAIITVVSCLLNPQISFAEREVLKSA